MKCSTMHEGHRSFIRDQGSDVRKQRSYAAALLASLGFLVLNSLIHIRADTYSCEEILLHDGFLPLYRPFTSHGMAASLSRRLPGFFPPDNVRRLDLRAHASSGLVQYPLRELEFKKIPAVGTAGSGRNRASIVLIVLESWQSAALRPEIMPHLWEFARKSTHFRNHISSGSATVPGLFGLMYGTHPTLYDSLKNVPVSHPSVFTEALHGQGYETRVFSGNNFERFQLRTLFFFQSQTRKLPFLAFR